MISAFEGGRWTAHEFFDLLAELGPLRVVSPSGPSTFEAICTVKHFGIARGFLNAITPHYHWHLDLRGFRHLRSVDEVHARSGRQVFYFELRTAANADPFLLIYLHREKNMAFERDREQMFAEIHKELSHGEEIFTFHELAVGVPS